MTVVQWILAGAAGGLVLAMALAADSLMADYGITRFLLIYTVGVAICFGCLAGAEWLKKCRSCADTQERRKTTNCNLI